MNSLKTPAVRCCFAAPLAALALALASPVHAGTVTLGTSGWEAHWDSSLDGLVDIDFVAFENGNIRKLSEAIHTPVLDDEQAGLNHFEHKTETRNFSRCAPHLKSAAVRIAKNAEVNSGTLDRRSKLRENLGRELEWSFED